MDFKEPPVVLNPAYVIAKVCYLYAGFLFLLILVVIFPMFNQ